MSYILDALKRSEQERHQDRGVDLSADLLILQKKKQKKSVWPWVLCGLLILNVIVLAYFFLAHNAEDNSLAPINEVSLMSSNQQQTVERSRGNVRTDESIDESFAVAPKQKAIPDYVQKKVVPPQRVLTSSANDRFAGAGGSGQEASDNAGMLEGEQLDERYEVIRPKNYKAQDLSISVSQVYEKNDKNSADQMEPYEGELIRPKTPSANYSMPRSTQAEKYVQRSQPSETVAQVNNDDLSRISLLSDLELRFQKSIPNLTFNSHIFSEKPSARRVMINNLYMREGEAFSGMTIVTIGEYYIHLNKGTVDFKLPVLRDWVSP